MPLATASCLRRLAIGSDHIGFELKETIKQYLEEERVPYDDLGTYSEEHVDYPLVAHRVAKAVAEGRYDRAILICGTGIGMAIVADKVPGVRAALCHDVYSAERARKSNDAQVLTMGARVIGPELAKSVVRAWLAADFLGGPSATRVQQIKEIDEMYRKL